MALFSSKDSASSKNAAPSPQKTGSRNGAISSIISQEMKISGELAFKGKARIDGTLEGNLKGEYLILSESAKIEGDIQTDTLICHGRVKGNINAATVTVHSTAAIQGKLVAASLTVEPGALISGEISAADKQTAAPGDALAAAKNGTATSAQQDHPAQAKPSTAKKK